MHRAPLASAGGRRSPKSQGPNFKVRNGPLLCRCLDPRGPCGGSLSLYSLFSAPFSSVLSTRTPTTANRLPATDNRLDSVCLSAGLLLQYAYGLAGYCACETEKKRWWIPCGRQAVTSQHLSNAVDWWKSVGCAHFVHFRCRMPVVCKGDAVRTSLKCSTLGLFLIATLISGCVSITPQSVRDQPQKKEVYIIKDNYQVVYRQLLYRCRDYESKASKDARHITEKVF